MKHLKVGDRVSFVVYKHCDTPVIRRKGNIADICGEYGYATITEDEPPHIRKNIPLRNLRKLKKKEKPLSVEFTTKVRRLVPIGGKDIKEAVLYGYALAEKRIKELEYVERLIPVLLQLKEALAKLEKGADE